MIIWQYLSEKYLKLVGTTKCPNCGEAIRPHRVCPKCGFYKGKEEVKQESAE